MLGTLLTFFTVGLLTLVAAALVLWVVGVVFSLTFGLASFLFFKVAPIVFVGWIVLRLIDRRGGGQLSRADRRWLDGE